MYWQLGPSHYSFNTSLQMFPHLRPFDLFQNNFQLRVWFQSTAPSNFRQLVQQRLFLVLVLTKYVKRACYRLNSCPQSSGKGPYHQERLYSSAACNRLPQYYLAIRWRLQTLKSISKHHKDTQARGSAI